MGGYNQPGPGAGASGSPTASAPGPASDTGGAAASQPSPNPAMQAAQNKFTQIAMGISELVKAYPQGTEDLRQAAESIRKAMMKIMGGMKAPEQPTPPV